jgi:hypothetical protein
MLRRWPLSHAGFRGEPRAFTLMVGPYGLTPEEIMAPQPKLLRTIKAPIYPPDHFTVEQARAAVLAVMAERGETPVPDVVEEVSLIRRSPRAFRKFVRCPARRKR